MFAIFWDASGAGPASELICPGMFVSIAKPTFRWIVAGPMRATTDGQVLLLSAAFVRRLQSRQ